MLHGRNAGPRNILELAEPLDHPAFSFLAPTAAGGTWYPVSFMQPRVSNEPFLSSALEAVQRLIGQVVEEGIPRERIMLLGFSQGACLALECGYQTVRRMVGQTAGSTVGGIIGFSGGLIGAPGTRWSEEGAMAGAPVFLGCSDVDAHIPQGRVQETATVFERLGAEVTLRFYPGMGHLVNEDELTIARSLMERVAGARG
jgi:predicted esterase